MNAEECATVQRLVSNLDRSRVYYLNLKRHLRSAHARFLVSRMIDLNSTAADDLAHRMLLAGGLAASRGGGALMRLRARAACLMTMASADRDAARLKCLARHGDRVMQRFQEAVARVKALHPRLHHRLLALERARFRIESFAKELDAWPATDDAYPARLAAGVLTQERSRR
jgi:hypothetical protein